MRQSDRLYHVKWTENNIHLAKTLIRIGSLVMLKSFLESATTIVGFSFSFILLCRRNWFFFFAYQFRLRLKIIIIFYSIHCLSSIILYSACE